MKVERLDEFKIKVTLLENELYQYGLDYESLNYSNEPTKQLVEDILLYLHDEENFVRSGHRLMIKSLPDKNGGCILFFTLLNSDSPPESREISPVVLMIEDSDSLLALLKRLSKIGNKESFSSSLYIDSDIYYFTLTNDNGDISADIISILLEYGEIVAQGKLAFSIINEHCKLIGSDILSHYRSSKNP